VICAETSHPQYICCLLQPIVDTEKSKEPLLIDHPFEVRGQAQRCIGRKGMWYLKKRACKFIPARYYFAANANNALAFVSKLQSHRRHSNMEAYYV